jgi:hypothetical protein
MIVDKQFLMIWQFFIKEVTFKQGDGYEIS